MTIGPAPMIRIEEMSVRLGMWLGDFCTLGTKKGRAFCASFGRRRVCVPARGPLFRPESAGREGHRRLAQHHSILTMFHTTSLRSRGAFLRPGFDFLASLTRMRGGRSTERRTGCFCRHPVGVLSGARQALVRRLASPVRETHASRRSTVAILGSGPALPSPAFAPDPLLAARS